MTRQTSYWLTLVAFIGISATISPAIRAQCESIPSQHSALVGEAIEKWETKTSTHLSVFAREDVLNEFCAAEAKLGGKVTDNQITSATAPAIADYLDRALDSQRSFRTLEAALREQLGFSGMARPITPRYAMVSMTYALPVDYVLINGKQQAAVDRFLIQVGDTQLEGISKARIVCQWHRVLVSGPTVFAQCNAK